MFVCMYLILSKWQNTTFSIENVSKQIINPQRDPAFYNLNCDIEFPLLNDSLRANYVIITLKVAPRCVVENTCSHNSISLPSKPGFKTSCYTNLEIGLNQSSIVYFYELLFSYLPIWIDSKSVVWDIFCSIVW